MCDPSVRSAKRSWLTVSGVGTPCSGGEAGSAPRSFQLPSDPWSVVDKTVAHDLRPQAAPGVFASTNCLAVPVAVSDSGVTSEALIGPFGVMVTDFVAGGSGVPEVGGGEDDVLRRVCEGVVLGCSVENVPFVDGGAVWVVEPSATG